MKITPKSKFKIIYEDNSESWGTYDPQNHTSDMCDKCGKNVGFKNLIDLPFIYHDYNDHVHSDVVPPRMYHQYRVCQECFERGV